MTESPLMIKSKEFSLNVIKACKELRNAKCEGALINRFCVQEQVLEQTFEKHFMLMERQILLQNFKLHLRNVAKPNIG